MIISASPPAIRMILIVRRLINIMSAFSQIMRELDEQKVRRRFGDRVRSLRKEIGISQEELALISGLDRTYIGGVERGERNVSLVNIHKLATALNVLVRDLF